MLTRIRNLYGELLFSGSSEEIDPFIYRGSKAKGYEVVETNFEAKGFVKVWVIDKPERIEAIRTSYLEDVVYSLNKKEREALAIFIAWPGKKADRKKEHIHFGYDLYKNAYLAWVELKSSWAFYNQTDRLITMIREGR